MNNRVETLRLYALSLGRPDSIKRLQEGLRQQEENGDIRIVYMDDDEARIQYINPTWARVLGSSRGLVQ